MRKSWIISLTIVIISFIAVHHTLNVHELIDFERKVDRNVKPCQLTSERMNEILNPTNQIGSNGKFVLINSKFEEFAIDSAPLLHTIDFQVCTIENNNNNNNEQTAKTFGDVTIVLQSIPRNIVYYGKHNADVLYRFVQKLDHRYSFMTNPVQSITNKMEKKAFEHVNGPKVVAYFPDTTAPAMAEYVQAARQLSPNPPFYLIQDPKIAQKFRLTEPGQIALIQPIERSFSLFESNRKQSTPDEPIIVVTTAEIVSWIEANRGLLLHELDDTNLYDPEIMDPNRYILAAIADRTTPFGLYFHKLLTKTIQNISRENEIRANQTQSNVEPIILDDLEIVWIDLQKYPFATIRLKNITNQSMPITTTDTNNEIYFGVLQFPANKLTTTTTADSMYQWFDISAHLSTVPMGKGDNESIHLRLLRDWILNVTDRLPIDSGNTETDQLNIEVMQQTFTLEPEPITVKAGSSFVLDCRVQYRAGQCQWIKDEMVVDVDQSANYKWANVDQLEDCSLMVTDADPTRDNGEWQCSVTDASMPDGTVVVEPIHSSPVTVSIQSRPVKKTKTNTKKNNNNKNNMKKKSIKSEL